MHDGILWAADRIIFPPVFGERVGFPQLTLSPPCLLLPPIPPLTPLCPPLQDINNILNTGEVPNLFPKVSTGGVGVKCEYVWMCVGAPLTFLPPSLHPPPPG